MVRQSRRWGWQRPKGFGNAVWAGPCARASPRTRTRGCRDSEYATAPADTPEGSRVTVTAAVPAYDGKTVLITGGTGSFGSTVVDHLGRSGCKEIRVLSRDEAKQDAMRNALPADHCVRFYIGDVRDPRSVEVAMRGADLVFHAAALKQVPSCEFFPLEAVATNVVGSSNVVRAATDAGAEVVVLLSTDKAVYPINAMGMTKALMEKVGQAAARDAAGAGTRVCTVRYGNVMYSRGSIIPLFVSQIKQGKPLTVTEPSMTRFLMPLSEAVDLVEYALLDSVHGDIFIRKAPASTVGDLATAVQNVFDRQVGTVRIGMRHGEKLYETLATSQELRNAQDMGDYYRVPMDDRDLNYAKYFSEGDEERSDWTDFHSHNARRLSVPEIEELLRGLPEIRAELAAWRAGAGV